MNTPAHSSPLQTLSIVTVTWNGRELVRRYLESINRCRRRLDTPLELILVDNASADGIPEMVEREFPWVSLLRNSENLGFAMGSRQGLDRARGDYLLLLNPDCEANPEALGAMVEFLRRHPSVGAVGCRLLYPDGTPQRSAYRDTTPLRYLLYHSLLSPALTATRQVVRRIAQTLRVPFLSRGKRSPYPCDWLMGACILVPRRVLHEVGSLDPSYFMYSEDADWCRRIRSAGYSIYHLPGPSMIHFQKQSSARTREFTYVRLYRSILMLSLRYMDPEQLLHLRRLVLIDMALRRWIFPLLGLLLPSTAQAQRERLRATRKVAQIWRRLDPDWAPDPPPKAAVSFTTTTSL